MNDSFGERVDMQMALCGDVDEMLASLAMECSI